MGLTLNLKRATKKINSTAVPSNELTVTDVVLKANTDILNPVFVLKKKSAIGLPTNINYVQCVDFNRYYWIDNIVQCAGGSGSSAAYMELHCHVDVLSSWKHLIGATPCFVKYCSDKSWFVDNHYVVDLRLDDDRLTADMPLGPMRTNILSDTIKNQLINPLNYNSYDYSYIVTLGTMGAGATSNIIYSMEQSNFATFIGELLKYTDFGTVNSSDSFFTWMADKLGGVCLDASQFIADIRVVPFKHSTAYTHGTSEFVRVGKVTMDGSGGNEPVAGISYITRNEYLTDIYDVDLQLAGIGAYNANTTIYKFLRRKKYLKVILSTPFGNIDISTDSFVEESKMSITVKVIAECTSGDISLVVYKKGSNEILGQISGNISLSLNHIISGGGYAQNELAGGIRTVTGLVGAIGGAVVAGPLGAAAGTSIAHTIGSLGSASAGLVQNSSAAGTSVVQGTNSWTAYILQGLVKDFQTQQINFDASHLFYVVTENFIPEVCYTHKLYESFAEKFGYPCNMFVPNFTNISTGNHFIQCSQFNVKMSTTSEHDDVMLPKEADEINQFLNTGIYWEVSASKNNTDDVR